MDKSEILNKLAALGYKTVAEIEGLAHSVNADVLQSYLGVPLDAIAATFFTALGLPYALSGKKEELANLSFTIMENGHWEPKPRSLDECTTFVEGIEAETGLPKSAIVKNLPPIRNQERRGTCVAFAVISALEVALGGKKDMSEQFMYWSTKQDDGYPTENGSFVRVAFPALYNRGVCTEKTWEYVPDDTNDPGQGPPSKKALSEALKCKPSKIFSIEPTDVEALKTAIAKGHCVSFAVPVFNSWFRNVETRRTGKIGMPIPNEGSVGGHAMALVGYADDASMPGGGYFVLRNSWGGEWAAEHPVGAGYGSIPYAYINQFCKDAWALCL